MLEFIVGVVAGVGLALLFAQWFFREDKIMVFEADAPYTDRVEAVFLTAEVLDVPIKLDRSKKESNDEAPEQAS